MDLGTGRTTRKSFELDFYEGGTHSVAYDVDGKLLVTSDYKGSGWTPLRRDDPASGSVDILGSVRQDSMLSASADRKVIGLAETNISDGRWGYYRAGDSSYVSQHQWYDQPQGGTQWFNYEIAVSGKGSQFAIPTYGGTFLGSATEVTPQIGQYAGVSPIGAAYSAVNDHLFLPFANTGYVAEYDSATLQEVNRFETGGRFDWTGNWAYGEGRTKVATDGSFLFSTLDNGVFFTALAAPVAEPATLLQLTAGLGVIGAIARRRRSRG